MLKFGNKELEELKEQLIKTLSDYPIIKEVRRHGNSLEVEFEQWIRLEDGTLVPHHDPAGPDYSVLSDYLPRKGGNK